VRFVCGVFDKKKEKLLKSGENVGKIEEEKKKKEKE
jgi:hypothetical protein